MSVPATEHAKAFSRSGRFVAAGLIALFGIAASVAGYMAVAASQRQLAQLNLANQAMSHRQVIEADLASATDALQTLQAYFDAHATTTREDFQTFARRTRERHVGLRNFGWAPRVIRSEREAFERQVRASGFPDFEIWERDAQNKRVRAGDKPEYYPILFPDPVERTTILLGFDTASIDVSADAMQRARIYDRPSATRPVRLISREVVDSFITFMPIYRRGDGEATDRFAGYVYGVFETAPMLERILAAKTRAAGLDSYYFNPAETGVRRMIHWHPSRTRLEQIAPPRETDLRAGPHWEGQLHVADQTWGVIFAPTEAVAARAVNWMPTVTLLVGLLMTGMIVAYLIVSACRTVWLEGLTRRIKATNSDLMALRAAFDDIDTGIMLIDRDLRVQFTNTQARQIWGLTEQALVDHPSLPQLIFSAIDKPAADVPHADLVGYLAGLLLTLRETENSTEDRELDGGEVIRCQCVMLPEGGWMLSYSRVTDLVRQSEQLAKLAHADSMTGAFNRRRFFELASAEWDRFAKTDQPLSLLMLDIDLFKSVNDRFGHDVGDDVIRAVANTCFASMGPGHIFGRIGGEEFALLLPQIELEPARVLAESIRLRIEQIGMRVGIQNVEITVSIGVAQAGPGIADIKALIKAADMALYEAKRTGRNRVSTALPGVIMAATVMPKAG